jgi:hypothetical protein
VLVHDQPIPNPTAESDSSHAGMGDNAGVHREAESLGFLVEVCERRPACSRAGVIAAQGLPRGAAGLGHLQDHYHQNDNDQDPDDGSDNSSVHFASSIRVLTRKLQIRRLNTNCR